ncbi:zinc finger MYM-type protein 1-like [Melanaphis sacchari]|uniref:zinc finger MYM-type protein 1-like n=1 Tax=Melanaphis sacchari TaxID=742174 RepID=UPI000DC15537|nr:zinc finger MYM-type protein 1-like [Melanaphis sacchari]
MDDMYLDVTAEYTDDYKITQIEYHSFLPYSTSALSNNDEVRIALHNTESYTLPLKVNDREKIRLLKVINNQKPLTCAFRSWELCEYPFLPQNTSHSWKVYLNSEVFPYEDFQSDFTKNKMTTLYHAYTEFQKSYYGYNDVTPLLNRSDFKNLSPIIVVDMSRQNDNVKMSTVDLRIELEVDEAQWRTPAEQNDDCTMGASASTIVTLEHDPDTTAAIENINIESNDDSVYADLFKNPTAEITTTTENVNLTYNSTNSVDLNIDVFSNDPAELTLLAPFSYEKRKLILNNGPCQPQKIDMPNKRFPVHNSRSFQCSWYMKTMPDGSATRREWISYSCSKDKIFCIYCILIGNEKSTVWTSTGFSSWNKASERIVMHETSSNHIEACLKIKLEDTCLPLLPSMLKARNEFVATNRKIVEAIIEIILYLARHSLAFRGHRESWSENLRGNFRDLVCLLGKYHPILASYIVGHQEKNKNKYDFISWRRQNQMIESLASYTRVVVLKQIKTAKFFSLTMDSTFDNSRKEQLSFVIRYLNEDSGEINERLINLKECMGQSYDGASNMRGSYNGLQAIIRRSNTAAIFVWCYAHRLNLVLTDAVSSSVNAVDMFGIIETIHDFINSSKKRVALFELHQEKCYGNKQRKRRFKRVQTTRWWSHDLALNTVLDTFDALCNTLEELQKSECTSDRKGAYQLFEIVTPLSKMLQTIDIDLIGVIAVVDDKIRELKKCQK